MLRNYVMMTSSAGEISIIKNIEIRLQRLERSVEDALDCYNFIGRPYDEENFIRAYFELQEELRAYLTELKQRLKRIEEARLCYYRNTGNRFFYSSIIQEWQACESKCNTSTQKLQILANKLVPPLPNTQLQYLNNLLTEIIAEFSSDTELKPNDLRVRIKDALLEPTLQKIQKDYFSNKATILSCFICYSWGNIANISLIHQIARDLKKGGINVKLDVWEQHSGSTQVFAEHINNVDKVIIMGAPDLVEKRQNFSSAGHSRGKSGENYKGNLVAQELELIYRRLNTYPVDEHGIINVLISGERDNSFPSQLQSLSFSDTDFRAKTHYSTMLLNLLSKLTSETYDKEKKRLQDQYHRIDSWGYEYLRTVYQTIDAPEFQADLDAEILSDLSKNSKNVAQPLPPLEPKPSKSSMRSSRVIKRNTSDEEAIPVTLPVAYALEENISDSCAISLDTILQKIKNIRDDKDNQIPTLKFITGIFLEQFKNDDELILNHEQRRLFPYFEDLLQLILECSDYAIKAVDNLNNIGDVIPNTVYLYLVNEEVKYVVHDERNNIIEDELQSTNFDEKPLFVEMKTVLSNLEKFKKLSEECEEAILSILLERGHTNLYADIIFAEALHKGAVINSNISGHESLKIAFKYALKHNRIINALRANSSEKFVKEKISCLENLSRLYHKRQKEGDTQKNIACYEKSLKLREDNQYDLIPSLNGLALVYACSGQIQKAIEYHNKISEITEREHEKTGGYICISVLAPDFHGPILVDSPKSIVIQQKDGAVSAYWSEANKTIISKSFSENEVDDIITLLPSPPSTSENSLLIQKIISKYGCDGIDRKNQYTSLLNLGIECFLIEPQTNEITIKGLEYLERGLRKLKPELENTETQIESINLNGIAVLMFLCNIGIGYYMLQEFSKAQRYLSKALQKQEELPEHDGIGLCAHYYGLCFIEDSMKIELGSRYLEQGFNIFIKCFKNAPNHLFVKFALKNCKRIREILTNTSSKEAIALLEKIQNFEEIFDATNAQTQFLSQETNSVSITPTMNAETPATLELSAAFFSKPNLTGKSKETHVSPELV